MQVKIYKTAHNLDNDKDGRECHLHQVIATESRFTALVIMPNGTFRTCDLALMRCMDKKLLK